MAETSFSSFRPATQEELGSLSMDELVDLQSALEGEINQVRLMIRQKKAHSEGAAAMFRKQF